MLGELQLRLVAFEGPLPLLLHLIERNELEITRVSVAAVADQFLALVGSAGHADLAATGEFVATAARLLLIKSRALLRVPLAAPEEGDEADDADALARQIAEYRRYQTAAQGIGALLQREERTWSRPPIPTRTVEPLKIPAVPVTSLGRAAHRLLKSAAPVALPTADWPEVEFAVLRADLLRQLRRMGGTTFAPLCRDAYHPLVVITMFLALLEMVRGGVIVVEQAQPYGEIGVHLRADA